VAYYSFLLTVTYFIHSEGYWSHCKHILCCVTDSITASAVCPERAETLFGWWWK